MLLQFKILKKNKLKLINQKNIKKTKHKFKKFVFSKMTEIMQIAYVLRNLILVCQKINTGLPIPILFPVPL